MDDELNKVKEGQFKEGQKSIEKEVEKPLDLEVALLEMQKLTEEMENYCTELADKMSKEGQEAGLSSKDIKDFQKQIDTTLQTMDEIVKSYEAEIGELKAQISLAEFTPSINKRELEEKINHTQEKKEDVLKIKDKIKNRQNNISTIKENLNSKENRIEREKKEKLSQAFADVNSVVIGQSFEKYYAKNNEDIFEINKIYYQKFSDTVLENQPDLAQDILEKRLEENPNLLKEFTLSAELLRQKDAFEKVKAGLNENQKQEIEKGLLQKENVEKSRFLFNAKIFAELLKEDKIDIEKLCDKLASEINPFDEKYLDNAENNKFDAVFMPRMVMEKVYDKMSDEEILKLTGERVKTVEEIKKIGYDYDLNKKAILLINFTNHPKYTDRRSDLKNKEEYWQNNYGKNIEEIIKSGDSKSIRQAIINREYSSKDVNYKIGEIQKISEKIKEIKKKRDSILKEVQEKGGVITDFEKRITETRRKGNIKESLELINELLRVGVERDRHLDLLLKELEREEKQELQKIPNYEIDVEENYIQKGYDSYDLVRGGGRDHFVAEQIMKNIDLVRKVPNFNRHAASSNLEKIKPTGTPEKDIKEIHKKINEGIEKNNKRKETIVKEQQEMVYIELANQLEKKLDLPSLELNWSVFENPVKKICEKGQIKELIYKRDKIKNWKDKYGKLDDKDFKGFFKKTVKIENLETEEMEEVDKDTYKKILFKINGENNKINEDIRMFRGSFFENLEKEMKDYYDNLIEKINQATEKRQEFMGNFEKHEQVEILKKLEQKKIPAFDRFRNNLLYNYEKSTPKKEFMKDKPDIENILKNSNHNDYRDLLFS
ncbi:MAG TPA: hypothetical protein PKH95_02885 [Candidatus Magasanikbacteria bacterium]|nr:hypothetical protein [Candidatus Magasanikbacteria bacterium]